MIRAVYTCSLCVCGSVSVPHLNVAERTTDCHLSCNSRQYANVSALSLCVSPCLSCVLSFGVLLCFQNLEQNKAFDFSRSLEEGKDTVLLFGPNHTGIDNIGNRSVSSMTHHSFHAFFDM